MSLFSKRYHPPGTAPGTLVCDDEEAGALHIALIDYEAEHFEERSGLSIPDCVPYLHRDTITWIDVTGRPDPDTLNRLGEAFGLHALALEDVLNQGQRAKVDAYDNQYFIVLHLPDLKRGRVRSQQISLFLGPRFVVSFHAENEALFEPVRKRLRAPAARIRARNADYLCYALIDLVVDLKFPLLEAVGETIEDLEADLLDHPDQGTMRRLHELKRMLLLLRRELWPEREAVNALMRSDMPLIEESTKLYLRDCYDHAAHILDLLETYREMTANLFDLYHSSVGNRIGEAMRVLTLIATVFIPLTFVVGVYGMNFDTTVSPWNMPELEWRYGYPAVWLFMLAAAGGMLFYFRLKKWI